jgi:hypothetical protein
MKATLYVLGGVAAMFAFGGVVIATLELLKWLFGGELGFLVFALALAAGGGGGTGWLIYRARHPRSG